MKWRALWLTLLLAVAAPPAPPAEACGGGFDTVAQTVTHPDLPLSRYAEGRLGLVRPTFKVPYLVVAYRLMSPLGLSDAERASAGDALEDRRRWSGVPHNLIEPWCEARAEVRDDSCPAVVTWRSRDYGAITNCTGDAFVHAAATLRQRVVDHGATDDAVIRFVQGQDAVFASCGAVAAVPPLLAPGASPTASADRAYHRAAAQMYAWDHDAAVTSFRAIAADPDSPWHSLARYLVARTFVRKASLEPEPSAAKSYAQAITELEALLADPGLASLHPAGRRLLDRARYHAEPHAQLRRLAVALASDRLGEDFGRMLTDYARLYGPGVAMEERDRLTTFVQIVERGDYDHARQLYDSNGARVWLAAALMVAPTSADTAPLREAAAKIDPADPAAPTLLFHRARLIHDPAERYDAITDALARLPPDLGPSTRVAFAELAMAAAATPDQLVPHLVARPAAHYWDGIPEAASDPAGLHPSAAAVVSALPVGVLAELATKSAIPEPSRARLAAAAWVRAELLGREDIADAIARAVGELNPSMAADVEAVRVASDAPRRRLALVIAMLRKPSLSPFARAWRRGPVDAESIASSYGAYWWCGPPKDAADLAVLDAADRAQARRELGRFAHSGSDWLAAEVVRLADALPDDPRVPEALHLAVRGTRYGCHTAETTTRSAAAFRRLHRDHPDSTWTERTPYHY